MSSDFSDRPRLYGRSKGRPLRAQQQGLMDEFFPKIQLQADSDFSKFDELWIEIGFGGADHLIDLARKNPKIAIIGAEPFLNGVAKAVAGAHEFGLTNLFLYHGDARDVLDQLPEKALSRIYILFPDPWPKTRHNKRRLINEVFLTDLVRVLKDQGQLFFASDIIDYVDWTLTRLKSNGHFKFDPPAPSSWRTPYKGWPGTRYEAKAFKADSPCHYLTFEKA
ncbi:MAG: tRNA (guanosine(46)-N7)-methyltransferase TrmB [Hellea sp.]|nr:tRNA (guanosine(46)-N7)-methyltransferase TrmB [Hellea sp.]